MAVRKDSVQISIAFLTDESKQYAKLIEENKKFIADIKTAQKEGKDLSKVIQDMAESGKKIGTIPLEKLAPAQLISRAQQLKQVLDLIPQSRPEYQALNAEYKSINDRLATLRATAKGISDDGKAAGGEGGFFSTVTGRVAVAVAGVQAFFAGLQQLFSFVSTSAQAADEAAKQDAALKSRIESTNGAAKRSFEELIAVAEDLASTTLFDDDQIKRGEELLLTFTNIRDEVFDETIPVLLDMSTVMEQDVSASAIQVGKALNDPIAGLKALSRVGVTFSAEQKDTIERLVEMNDVAGAQRVILAELRKEFGGAAQAAASAGAGGFQQLQKRFGEIKETLGGAFISVLDRLGPVVNFLLNKFEALAEVVTDVFSIPVSEKLREQQTEFNALIGVLQNVNSSEESRKRAINELQSKYPGYIGNIDLHKASESQLNEILNAGNNLFATRIFLQEKEEKLADIAKRRNDLQKQQFEAEKNLQTAQNRTNEGRGFFGFGLSKQEEVAKFKNVVSAYTQQLQYLTQEENNFLAEQQAFAQRFGINTATPTNTGGEKNAGGGGSTPTTIAGKAKVEADAAVGSLAYLRQKVAELQKQLENAPGDTKVLNPLIEKLKQAEAQLKDLEDKIARLRAGDVQVLPTDAEIFGQLGGGLFQEQGLTDAQRLAVVEAGDFRVQDEQLTIEEINALRQGLSDEDRARREQDAADAARYAQEKRDFELQAASDVASAVFSIERSNNEQRAAEQISALEADYRRKIAAAEGNNALQQKLQRELEQKKEAIEKEAARKRQGTAAKEAIVQGALAFIRALATGGPFAAAGVAVATAAQLAIIASQKFARGGYTGSGVGMPDSTGFRPAGIVHEGEYVIPKSLVEDRQMNPVLRYIERRRLRGYADGGFVAPSTDPVAPYAAAGSVSIGYGSADFVAAVNEFKSIVASFPREVKSRLVYQELQDAQADLNATIDDASV